MANNHEEIPDPDLRFVIAGALSMMAQLPQFPVKVRAVDRVNNAEGQADGFRIVTDSGLKFRVDISFEEQP